MPDLSLIRTRLLDLHKQLVDVERKVYEAAHGRVTAHEFLRALTQAPELKWLAPLNAAIVRLDELTDPRLTKDIADVEAALAEHLGELRGLLTLEESATPDAFTVHYAELVHQHPDITFAHSALWNALRTDP